MFSSVILDEVDILFGDEGFEQVLQTLSSSAPMTSQYLFVTATLPVDIYNKLVETFPDCEVIMGPGLHRMSSRLEEVNSSACFFPFAPCIDSFSSVQFKFKNFSSGDVCKGRYFRYCLRLSLLSIVAWQSLFAVCKHSFCFEFLSNGWCVNFGHIFIYFIRKFPMEGCNECLHKQCHFQI